MQSTLGLMFSWCEPFISWLTPPTFYRLYRFIFCNQQASLYRGNVSFDQPGLGTLRYGGPVYQVGSRSNLWFLFDRTSSLFRRSYPSPLPPRRSRGGRRRGLLRPNRFEVRPNRNNRLDPLPNRLPQGPPYRKVSSPGRSTQGLVCMRRTGSAPTEISASTVTCPTASAVRS